MAELAPQLPATRLVYVADREADMLPLMAHAQALGGPADWLVRATHNRCLPDGNRLWGHTCAGDPVWPDRVRVAGLARRTGAHGAPAVVGTPRRAASRQRQVRQRDLYRGTRIRDAPAGVKPIEWRLLTNRTADTAAAVAELIDWYRARWKIEILFDVLKNACRVEALQLGTIERIERVLALYLVVAWRIAHLMRLERICPNLDAALFFDPDEIEAARRRNIRTFSSTSRSVPQPAQLESCQSQLKAS